MNIKNRDLKLRIIELSYKYRLSHLGSCLSAVDIIDEIYASKKPLERFVLSAGHAGLALYVVLEKYGFGDAEMLLKQCGVHPNRIASRLFGEFSYSQPIDCSTGSLGQGLPIAVGMALSDREKNVYCLVSDGECAEGSIYEAVNAIKSLNITNLKIFVNYNGYGAYRSIGSNMVYPLFAGIGTVVETNVDYVPFLKGLNAHYHVMDEEEYKNAKEILK